MIYTTDEIFLRNILTKRGWCLSKQSPCSGKLFSFFEEILVKLLDDTNVVSYFYNNIVNFSQSQHRIKRVRRGSNKKSFAIKLFQVFDLETRQRFILQEEVNVFQKVKENSFFSADSLRGLSKFSIERASVNIFHFRNPRLELDLQSQNAIFLLARYYKNITKYPNEQTVWSLWFGNKKSCLLSNKMI